MPHDLAPLSTLIGSNYPCLELIFMVPVVSEPLKFYCISLAIKKRTKTMHVLAVKSQKNLNSICYSLYNMLYIWFRTTHEWSMQSLGNLIKLRRHASHSKSIISWSDLDTHVCIVNKDHPSYLCVVTRFVTKRKEAFDPKWLSLRRNKLYWLRSKCIGFDPKSGRVAQSVRHLTRKSGVLGSIPGLATYFRFSFRFFKKGSCQLLPKVCARSTG